MAKFGLEYFAKRGQILCEMARPNVFQKGGFDQFNDQVYKPTVKALQTVGNVPSTLARGKAIQYLIYMIAQKEIQKSGDNVKEFIKRMAGPVEQWNTPGEHPSDQKRDEYVLVSLVKKKLKQILSPQSVADILDDENVATFAKENRIPQTSNYAQGRAKETENVFDMPIDQLDALRTQVTPIIRKLNMATRKAKGGGDTSIGSSDVSDPVQSAKILSDVMEEVLNDKLAVDKNVQLGKIPQENSDDFTLSKIPLEAIQTIYNNLQKAVKNGQGFPIEEFYSQYVDKYEGHQNPRVQAFGAMLRYAIEGIVDNEDYYDTVSDFGPYDSGLVYSLLDAGQITREDMELLKQWIPIAKKQQELRQMKQDSQNIGNAADEYLNKPIEKEESEEGIMGYMREQVATDSLYKPNGVLRESNFKKFENYNHWLNFNKAYIE